MAPPLQLSKAAPAELRCQNKPERPSRPRKLFLYRVSKLLRGTFQPPFKTLKTLKPPLQLGWLLNMALVMLRL